MELVTLKAIATDNLVSRNGARYPASELPVLASLLVGCPAIADHYPTVDREWGRIRDAQILKPSPPPNLDEHNQAIVDEEGYQQIIVDVETRADHPLLADFASGVKTRVSICAAFTTFRCPGCNCKAGNFFSSDCPNVYHSVPYFERVGVCDAFELSLVVIPAVKQAKVLLSR
jgi:hypothetical protein